MIAIAKPTKTREYNQARAEANRRYNEKAYERIYLQVPKEKGLAFKAKCKQQNIPQRQVLIDAIDEFLGE